MATSPTRATETSASTAYANFDTDTPPRAFDLLSPVDGGEIISPSLFDWEATTHPLGLPFTYTFLIADDAEFTQFNGLPGPYRQENLLRSDALEPASLSFLKTYYWKVTAQDRDGVQTPSAETFQFSIPILNRPKAPTGLQGEMASDRVTFTLSWNAVTENTDGTSLTDLGAYRIYRSLFTETIGDGTFHATVAASCRAAGI